MTPFLTTSVFEAKKLYYSSKRESITQRQAMKEWKEFALTQVQNAQTFTELEKAYLNTPPKSDAKSLAITKWLEICTTTNQIKRVQEKTSKGSKDHWLAHKKLAQLQKQTQ